MEKILYYGSKTMFQKPIFGYGNPSNDYGLGFYLSDDLKTAKMWAGQYDDGGFVLVFKIDFDKLDILHLGSDSEVEILNWITLLAKNRFDVASREKNKDVLNWLIKHFDVDLTGHDLVIGYRADDAYFRYARDFVEGNLSLEKLSEAMKLGKLGLQYVLMSKKAYELISFQSFEMVKKNEDYSLLRRKALDDYHRIKAEDNRFKNTFIGDLMKKYGE